LRVLFENAEGPLSSLIGIVESDICLSAQILRLVNSDYISSAGQFLSIPSAVKALGVEHLREIVKNANIFVDQGDISEIFDIELVTRHSRAVAESAVKIASLEQLSNDVCDLVHSAGFLHEIGRLLLTFLFPEQYREVIELVLEENVSHFEAEQRIFSCNHTDVGAYLLALWGLPDQMIEAVAFQGDPTRLHHTDIRAVSVLHAANAIQDELLPVHFSAVKMCLNEEYLRGLNTRESATGWRMKALEKKDC
jgi:HD-like signal output (HDOD) protein